MYSATSLSKTLPAMITCECDQMLSRLSIEDAYGKPVQCDDCQKKLKLSAIAYHCINNHCYCLKCSVSLVSNSRNKGLVNPIHCACQEIMILTQPIQAYGSGAATCNNSICRAKIGKLEYCYHCPKGKSSVHPKGYDYCMKCSKQKSINKSKTKHNLMYGISRSKTENEALLNENNELNSVTEPLIPSKAPQNNMQHFEEFKEQLEVVGKDYENLKNALVNNIRIKCDCGSILIMTKPYISYKAGAECDICREKIAGFEFCFHCPQEKNMQHRLGFDVCLNCAIGNKLQLLKYKITMKKNMKKLNRYQKSIKPEVLIIFEQKSDAIQKSSDCICEVMPVMIEKQNMVFNELIKKINAMNEIAIPGIDNNINEQNEHKNEVSDHSSDIYNENEPLIEKLSLKQLYAMRNVLNECVDKYKDMGISIEKLTECINYKINDMQCEWQQWNANDIVDWIIQLENGRFVIYEDILRKELNDGDATGAILPHLDISDWRKSFAIKNWKDAVDLNKYKDILVTNKKEQPKPQHIYVSPFDPAQEGANTQ